MRTAALTLLLSVPAAAATVETSELLLVMREMEFAIEGLAPEAPLVLKAGKRYKLAFENHGAARHEVLFGRGLTRDAEGELDYETHLFRDVELAVWGRSMVGGEKRIYGMKAFGLSELELDPGTRLSIYVTIPESARGTWEIGCFSPGHHEHGMKRVLLIE